MDWPRMPPPNDIKTRRRGRSASTCWLLLLLVLVLNVSSQAQQEETSSYSYSFDDLSLCDLTSKELTAVNATTAVNPCILYDTINDLFGPTFNPNHNDSSLWANTTIITVVGVFATASDIYRDGGLVAVQKLNQGKGAPIGYYSDHYVKFRLVVGIAGNRDQLGPMSYGQAHQEMLRVLLTDLKPHYILGTSSFDSEWEREIAGEFKVMLLAQVGPQAFYTSNKSNDHVFGAHIPSEGYGIPAFQALRFDTKSEQERLQKKIRIIYRDRSEFFYSTCRAVYDRALLEGFADTKAIEYNPDDDPDGNGVLNKDDIPFLQSLADQACSPEDVEQANENDNDNNEIAVWGCFLTDTEVNTVLQRLRDNGCRLSMLWLTVASWAWPSKHPNALPFVQSGGQWHQSMSYSDEFFDSGQAMLDHMQDQFGYDPSYGALGAYHAMYLMYQNIRKFFKAKDEPLVAEMFASASGYEEIRRSMLDLSLPHTLYGPTSFDEDRRNVGRGSAGMQWDVPETMKESNNSTTLTILEYDFELLLVSPIDQATSAVQFPAPSSRLCRPGSFVNRTKIEMQPDILGSKCDECPVNTFQPESTNEQTCLPCAGDSNTEGQTGATICVQLEDNLVPKQLFIFGYAIMAIVFGLAVGFAVWTIWNRDDPVVRIGQVEFLLLICLGPIISSSSIAALSVQAGSLDDEAAASRACKALPWLYTTGWMLQYGSLSAKSYRMYRTTRAAETMTSGRTVSAVDMYMIIAMLMLLNWAIVIPWTILDPLVWERQDTGTTVDTELHVLTYESYGRCSSNHLAYWIGPILALHAVIMLVTNYLLYKIRNVSDRYQEFKYVAMASAYACEFLIVGIPIIIAVGENAIEASYIVLVCIVGLSDMGILLMIFVPKIKFRAKGLPEGVTVGQSIFKKSAVARNGVDSSVQLQEPSHHFQATPEGHKAIPNAVSPVPGPPKRASSNIGESSGASSQNALLIEILKEGVAAKPPEITLKDENETKKRADDGALVNNMSLQW